MVKISEENIINKSPKALSVIFLIIYGSIFIYCMSLRLFYPFEINWLEGEIFINTLRVFEGKDIYQNPASGFITEIYPPVFYWTGSVFFLIFGKNIWALRLISLCSFTLLIFLIQRISTQEKKGTTASLTAITIFVALYQANGTWYDVARVDMLFLCIAVTGLYFISFTKSYLKLFLGTSILILSFFTKQVGIFFISIACLYIFLSDRKKGILFTVTSFSILTLSVYLYNWFTDGWFLVYIFDNPRHITISESFISDITSDILPFLPILLFVILDIFRRIFRKREQPDIWDLAFLISIFSFLFIRCRTGSHLNDHIPLTYFTAVIFSFKIFNKDSYILKRKFNIKTISIVILLIQMCILLYNPLKYIPNQNSEYFGKNFIKRIRDIEGEVFMPYHQFYAYLAGKKTYLSAGAHWAYRIGNYYYPEEVINKLRSKKFSIVIIDDLEFKEYILGKDISKEINNNYYLKECVYYHNSAEFNIVAGNKTRPLYIYYPKNSKS